MCGKSTKVEGEFKPQILDDTFSWIHRIKLEQPGYGSFLDTCDIETIYICDSCLKDLFEEMEVKPEVDPLI